MKNVYMTVKQPVITEKATIVRDTTGAYCFRAHPKANKVEIARAVEQLFGVKVVDVRTARVPGKVRRMGRTVGRKPSWKKAWVRLAPGEKEIDLFEQK